MITLTKHDAIHKAWLYRLLIHICDTPLLSRNLYFKDGTCAMMLGYLDRFSVDLDFDFLGTVGKSTLRKELKMIFHRINLAIKYENPNTPQFILKYAAIEGRHTLNLDIIDTYIKSNRYRPQYLPEIDRYAQCQTIETMFAHKLVSVIDRYEKYKSIAGRDIYDIHHFFSNAYPYSKEVIEERTGKGVKEYLTTLSKFIEREITQKLIDQDLNPLLSPDTFQSIRKTLKEETLLFLSREILSYG